jgi:hypothetical protein
MDNFSVIQHFFTRMHCNLCAAPFEADGIQLIREEDGFYVVSVSCRACDRQIGVAMVGVENGDSLLEEDDEPRRIYADPELTEEELERLEQFPPISYDDVLSAHTFFQNLDERWKRFIPEEIRERCTVSDTE